VVKSHAMFLRAGCTLPGALGLEQEPFGTGWMFVENAAAAALDLAVRKAGWHFMWIANACSRFGFGRTGQSATNRAIIRALTQTMDRFNAAELGSVHVSECPVFGLPK